jgi:hypothetical protein
MFFFFFFRKSTIQEPQRLWIGLLQEVPVTINLTLKNVNTAPTFIECVYSLPPPTVYLAVPKFHLSTTQTVLIAEDWEQIDSFKYHAQVYHNFLILRLFPAFCVPLNLANVCYIPRSLMPDDFYKLRILPYAIQLYQHPHPPQVTYCLLWSHPSYAKIITKHLQTTQQTQGM